MAERLAMAERLDDMLESLSTTSTLCYNKEDFGAPLVGAGPPQPASSAGLISLEFRAPAPGRGAAARRRHD